MIGGSEMHENESHTYKGASERNMRDDEGEFTAVNIRSAATKVPIHRPPTSRVTCYQSLAWEYWTAIAQPEGSEFHVME